MDAPVLATPNDEGISQVIIINSLVASSLFFLFCLLRKTYLKKVYWPYFFFPSYYTQNQTTTDETYKYFTELDASLHLFSWIWLIIRFSDEDVFDRYGIDTYFYICFYRRLFYSLSFLSFFAMTMLLPVHLTGENKEGGIQATLLSNIAEDSPRLWVHLLFTYLTAFIFFIYLIIPLYRLYVEKRQFHLKQPHLPSNFTIQIKNLDYKKILQNVEESEIIFVEDKLKEDYFNLFCADRVLRVRLPLSSRKLSNLIKAHHALNQRYQVVRKKLNILNLAVPTLQVLTRKRAKLENNEEAMVQELLSLSAKIDSCREDLLKFLNQLDNHSHTSHESDSDEEGEEKEGKISYKRRLKEVISRSKTSTAAVLSEGFEKLNQVANPAPTYFTRDPRTNVAFVTFKDSRTANFCSQSLISTSCPSMDVSLAPDPNAINWRALKISLRQHSWRNFLSLVLWLLVIIGWAIPTFYVSDLFTVSQLFSYLAGPSFLHDLPENPETPYGIFVVSLVNFANWVLPTLGTYAIMLSLGPVAGMLIGLEAHHDYVSADISLLKKYFAFLVFNLLFVTIFFPRVLRLVTDPESHLQSWSENQTSLVPCYFNGKEVFDHSLCIFLSITSVLGNLFPKFGAFYLGYVINAALIGSVLTLFRPYRFLQYTISQFLRALQRMCRNKGRDYKEKKKRDNEYKKLKSLHMSQREANVLEELRRFDEEVRDKDRKEKWYIPDPYPFSENSAMHSSVAAVIMAYSNLCPLILPAGMFYFGLFLISDKNNLLFVYPPAPYSRQGLMLEVFLGTAFVSMIIQQVVIFSVMCMKKALLQAVCVGFLVLACCVGYWHVTKRFHRLAQHLALDDLTQPISAPRSFETAYLQPEFRYDLRQDFGSEQDLNF